MIRPEDRACENCAWGEIEGGDDHVTCMRNPRLEKRRRWQVCIYWQAERWSSMQETMRQLMALKRADRQKPE